MLTGMCQTNLSRRTLLRYSALVAATFPAAAATDCWSLAAQAAESGLAVPMHAELVTVTDTSAVITWFTGDPLRRDGFGRPAAVQAPGRVLIGTSLLPSTWREAGSHGPTAYHHVEITGLQPDTTYHWRAESNGIVAGPSPVTPWAAPSTFTTLKRPAGRELGRVAWLNDLHFGEQIAGLAVGIDGFPGGGLPPGIPVDPQHPYWRTMGAAAVAESRARGCNLLLANGDLSNEAEAEALAETRTALDGFGSLGGVTRLGKGDAPRYFVTRGNHDRARTGAVEGELVDRFGGEFDAGFEPGTQHFSVGYGTGSQTYRFVGLDSNDGETTGVLRASELEFLEAELGRGDLTIPLFHHPASQQDNKVDADGARRFRTLLAGYDNAVGVYAGHTHRNHLSTSSETATLPYFEGGAVKEYPGGYTVVRLFEGGFTVNFYKSSHPDALAWSEASRAEWFGLAPAYMLGGLGDRNWAHHLDTRRTQTAGVLRDGGDALTAEIGEGVLDAIC